MCLFVTLIVIVGLQTLEGANVNECACAAKAPTCSSIGSSQCPLGERFEFGSCVFDCTTGYNGPTFIVFPGREVLCDVYAQFFSTLQGCLNDCLWNSDCKSAVYYDSTGFCFHSPCDPVRNFYLSAPPVYSECLGTGVTLYMRNCVVP